MTIKIFDNYAQKKRAISSLKYAVIFKNQFDLSVSWKSDSRFVCLNTLCLLIYVQNLRVLNSNFNVGHI